MEKVTLKGKKGFYDGKNFYAADDMEKVTYQGTKGYYSSQSGFIPAEPVVPKGNIPVTPDPTEFMEQYGKGGQTGTDTGQIGDTGIDLKQMGRQVISEQDPTLDIAGSMGGSALMSPTGPGGMLAGAFGGGAAAGRLKQFLRTMLQGEEPPSYPKAGMKILEEGGEGLLGEGMGNIGQIIARKQLAPMVSKADDLPQLVKTALEKKLPIRPSSLIPSKRAKVFEWIGESLPTGKAWMTHKTKQLQKGLHQMSDDILGKLPKRTDKLEAGEILGQEIKEGVQGEFAEKVYAPFYAELKKGGGIGFKMSRINDDVIHYLNTQDSIPTELKRWLKAWQGKGQKGNWSVEDIANFQRQIWSKTFKNDRTFGEKLYKSLHKDVGGNASAKLKQSLDDYKDLISEFRENKTIKNIARKYRTHPDKVILETFRSGNMEDLIFIKKSVSPETWDIARSRFIENLIDVSTELKGNSEVFMPGKFVNLFDKYSAQIKNVMPELHKNLDDFANISRASLEDIDRVSGSQIGNQLRIASGAGGLGGITQQLSSGSTLGAAGVAVPFGFSFSVAKSLMNPKGWLKQYLTTGFKASPLIKESIRAGVTTAETKKPGMLIPRFTR